MFVQSSFWTGPPFSKHFIWALYQLDTCNKYTGIGERLACQVRTGQGTVALGIHLAMKKTPKHVIQMKYVYMGTACKGSINVVLYFVCNKSLWVKSCEFLDTADILLFHQLICSHYSVIESWKVLFIRVCIRLFVRDFVYYTFKYL